MRSSTITTIIDAVHVRLEGYSAFFRYTGFITGRQPTRPCPTYANLLGLVSACTGKIVTPYDTRVGFEFSSVSKADDLERTNRLMRKKRTYGEVLIPHTKGKGLVRREVHFLPKLDLYLTNLDLYNSFISPVVTPTLGRSQDLCWITQGPEIVKLTPVTSGMIGITMIGRPDKSIDESIPSIIMNCAEWFRNDDLGFTRVVESAGYYQITQPDEDFTSKDGRVFVSTTNLYQPSNLPNGNVVYLHEWIG